MNLLGDRLAQSQLVVDLPQQQHAGVARNPVIRKFDLNRAIEFRLKSSKLAFTPRVNLRECLDKTFTPEFTRWFSFLKTFC